MRGKSESTRTDGQSSLSFCVSLCGESKQCPSATTQSGTLDCNALCSAYEAVARDGACSALLDEYLTCYSHSDACSTQDTCNVASVTNCVGTYCSAHPGDADCTVLGTAAAD